MSNVGTATFIVSIPNLKYFERRTNRNKTEKKSLKTLAIRMIVALPTTNIMKLLQHEWTADDGNILCLDTVAFATSSLYRK